MAFRVTFLFSIGEHVRCPDFEGLTGTVATVAVNSYDAQAFLVEWLNGSGCVQSRWFAAHQLKPVGNDNEP